VVEHHKLLWPQAFSSPFWRLVPTTWIWNTTTLRSLKQQIWLRTALCGDWCRHVWCYAILKLHARNDDNPPTEVATTSYIISSCVHHPGIPSSRDRYAIGKYAAEHSTQRHRINRPSSCPNTQVRKLQQLMKEIGSTTDIPRGNRERPVKQGNCRLI